MSSFFILAVGLCFGNSQFNEQKEKIQKIQEYASCALVSILETGPILEKFFHNKLLHKIKKCELHGYHAMVPLLLRNAELCFSEFIKKSFASKHSDLFLNAIYRLLKNKEEFGALLLKHAGDLFLLSQFRIKTGSIIAQKFLKKYIPFYANKIGYTDIQLENELKKGVKIEIIPFIHFHRVAEDVVKSCLSLMKSKFKVSLKVLIDVLIPWVRLFRLLRNPGMCVPTVNTFGKRLLPSEFLNDLLEITKNTSPHEFQRVAGIWACLLETEDHKQLIPTYILECANNDIKRRLFGYLFEKFPEEIGKFLVKQCKFSYYAYITYQCKSDFENEFWITPVLSKIIKTETQYFEDRLPLIAQFSLLFHSNQTQYLLKSLCQTLSIPYNRRTLSISSIRQIVGRLQNVFQQRYNNDKEKLKKNMLRWIMESMRWSIGCKNLRIAYTSLIILNTLDENNYLEDENIIIDLLHGLCESCAYFLNNINVNDNEKEKSSTYDFINETFTVFNKHFDNNEEFCLNYIKTYLPFVITVDAYFSEILPLYLKCLKSDKVREESLQCILHVLRPSFNELESDSKTRKTFYECLKMRDVEPWKIDLLFVNAALQKNIDVNELINTAKTEQLNRAFNHYALMMETASVDLKRRIFENSSLILQRIENEVQKNKNKKINKNKNNKKNRLIQPTSLTETSIIATQQNIKLDENNNEISTSHEQLIDPDNELNKQSLLTIFQEAIKMLPEMDEALVFIQNISRFDPLISTLPVIDDKSWPIAAKSVINELDKLGTKGNNVVVLTDCVDLNSTSNLLNPNSEPKILPFTSFHDILSNMMGGKGNHQIRSMGSWFDRISRKFFTLIVEIQTKLSERIEQTQMLAKGNYQPLPLNLVLINDNNKIKKVKPRVDILCSNEEFLKMLPDKNLSKFDEQRD